MSPALEPKEPKPSAIEQAIRDAMETGGYRLPRQHMPLDQSDAFIYLLTDGKTIKYQIENENGRQIDNDYAAIADTFLDPTFWQALGKARGWNEFEPQMFSWRYHWHRFIDHLAVGKDAESFFASLV